MRALLLVALVACTGEAPTGVDYCELPNAQALMGCSEERLTVTELARCNDLASRQSIRMTAGIPEACREPGAPRRMPTE